MTISGIVTLAIALLGAFLGSPWGAGLASGYANRLKQTRAFGRIRGMEGMEANAVIRFDSADAGGGSSILGGEHAQWKIVSFTSKRIVLHSTVTDYPYTVQLTPAEFEAGTAFLVGHVLEDDDEKSG
ncbi:MAG: hypothetical protein OXC91_00865 [Rhodobacteraceae bacterium]|nr:hypothetical protein [Paracoccaceae bacterium]